MVKKNGTFLCNFRWKGLSGIVLPQQEGGRGKRNFFCEGPWRCDIAMPGNQVCAFESGWLLKRLTKLVMAAGFAISLNMIDQKFEM